MKILQAGVAKSGNFWLYRILKSILQRAGLPETSFIQNHPIHPIARTWQMSFEGQEDVDVIDIEPAQFYYRISSYFKMPIDDLDEYLAECSLLWTHSPYCNRTAYLAAKVDKIVYIIRDPRDVALSMAHFAFTPYSRFTRSRTEPDVDAFLQKRLSNMVYHWCNHVGGYLSHQNTLSLHVVFYERLLNNFDSEVEQLLAYLGIHLKKQDILDIQDETNFSSMQKRDPKHVRVGQSYQWVVKMTKSQVKQTVRIASDMLKLLGYPLADQSQTELPIPALPHHLSLKQLQRAMTSVHRGRLFDRLQRMMLKSFFTDDILSQ